MEYLQYIPFIPLTLGLLGALVYLAVVDKASPPTRFSPPIELPQPPKADMVHVFDWEWESAAQVVEYRPGRALAIEAA